MEEHGWPRYVGGRNSKLPADHGQRSVNSAHTPVATAPDFVGTATLAPKEVGSETHIPDCPDSYGNSVRRLESFRQNKTLIRHRNTGSSSLERESDISREASFLPALAPVHAQPRPVHTASTMPAQAMTSELNFTDQLNPEHWQALYQPRNSSFVPTERLTSILGHHPLEETGLSSLMQATNSLDARIHALLSTANANPQLPLQGLLPNLDPLATFGPLSNLPNHIAQAGISPDAYLATHLHQPFLDSSTSLWSQAALLRDICNPSASFLPQELAGAQGEHGFARSPAVNTDATNRQFPSSSLTSDDPMVAAASRDKGIEMPPAPRENGLNDNVNSSLPVKSSSTKPKKKKTPKPKRALTAYNMFFRDQRAKLLASSKGRVGFEQMGQVIGKLWNEADESTKSSYQAAAAEEKKRYQIERARFAEKFQEELEAKRAAMESTVPQFVKEQYFAAEPPKRR